MAQSSSTPKPSTTQQPNEQRRGVRPERFMWEEGDIVIEKSETPEKTDTTAE